GFNVCTYMQNAVIINGEHQDQPFTIDKTADRIGFSYDEISVKKNDTVALQKLGGYVTGMNHPEERLIHSTEQLLDTVSKKHFSILLEEQANAWKGIWEMSDITIEGDTKAQQGIRFNIFQLNQTYLGKDARLNIGPK